MVFGWLKPDWLLRREAARLLARMELDPSPANKQALDRWRNDHPRQADMLRTGGRVLRDSVHLRGDETAGSNTHQRAGWPASNVRTTRVASFAVAALAVAALFVMLRSNILGQPAEAMTLTTKAGEFREFPLSDGTRVMLNPASAVRVEIDHDYRRALVERGRARFTVAKRDTPFLVRSPAGSARIYEGVIDVSSTPTAGVRLVKGTASVTTPGAPEPIIIRAPARVSGAANPAPAAPAPPSVPMTPRRLSFDRARLQDVVAAANQNTAIEIVIRDPTIADLRVTGVFRVDDAQGLGRALAAAFGLQLAHLDHNKLLLTLHAQHN